MAARQRSVNAGGLRSGRTTAIYRIIYQHALSNTIARAALMIKPCAKAFRFSTSERQISRLIKAEYTTEFAKE
jgi:hypothetical protein